MSLQSRGKSTEDISSHRGPVTVTYPSRRLESDHHLTVLSLRVGLKTLNPKTGRDVRSEGVLRPQVFGTEGHAGGPLWWTDSYGFKLDGRRRTPLHGGWDRRGVHVDPPEPKRTHLSVCTFECTHVRSRITVGTGYLSGGPSWTPSEGRTDRSVVVTGRDVSRSGPYQRSESRTSLGRRWSGTTTYSSHLRTNTHGSWYTGGSWTCCSRSPGSSTVPEGWGREGSLPRDPGVRSDLSGSPYRGTPSLIGFKDWTQGRGGWRAIDRTGRGHLTALLTLTRPFL